MDDFLGSDPVPTVGSVTTLERQPDMTLVRAMLTSPATYATTLLTWTLDRYGPEALTWAPETLRLELERDFGVKLPKPNHDRLMAAIAIMTTDYFYTKVDRFVQLANILAFDEFDPENPDIADGEECAWAITEAMLLWPPNEEDPDDAISEDIRIYITEVLREEGYIRPPKSLKFLVGGALSSTIDFSPGESEELWTAAYETQSSNTDDVDEMVADNLRDLFTQLATLPLREGNVKPFLDKIKGLVPKKGRDL